MFNTNFIVAKEL